MLTMCFKAIKACALFARLRFASQDGKENNEAKIITRVPQEAQVKKLQKLKKKKTKKFVIVFYKPS